MKKLLKEWSYLVILTKNTMTEKMCIIMLPKQYHLVAGCLHCVWIHPCLGKTFVYTTIWGTLATSVLKCLASLLRIEVRSVECLMDDRSTIYGISHNI